MGGSFGARQLFSVVQAVPRLPSWVLHWAQPPRHWLRSQPVGLGQAEVLQTPGQSLSGPQRPASLVMALVGVLPQCSRYIFQEFGLFSHLTLSQPVHLPRSAETTAGIKINDKASTNATRVPKILLTVYASLIMEFEGILQGRIKFVNSHSGSFS